MAAARSVYKLEEIDRRLRAPLARLAMS